MFPVRANQQVYLLFPVKFKSRKGANKDTESCVKMLLFVKHYNMKLTVACVLFPALMSVDLVAIVPFIFVKHKQLVKTTLLVCMLHVFHKVIDNI